MQPSPDGSSPVAVPGLQQGQHATWTMRRLATDRAAFLAAIVAIAVASSSSQGSGKTYDVRAIFDDAAFAVPGEDVRIAGAPVGSIQSLDVHARMPAARRRR